MEIPEPIAVERVCTWWHFSGRRGRDARGCIVAWAEQPHCAPGDAVAALG